MAVTDFAHLEGIPNSEILCDDDSGEIVLSHLRRKHVMKMSLLSIYHFSRRDSRNEDQMHENGM